MQEHPTLALLVRQILKEMQVREEFYRETTMGLLRALVVEMARLNPEGRKKTEEQIHCRLPVRWSMSETIMTGRLK